MKFITIKLVLLFSVILTSCGSDELTKSKAENLIRDCEEKSGKPAIKTTSFDYGRIEVVSYGNTKYDSKMKLYTKYKEMGLVTIDTLPAEKSGSWGIKKELYQVNLTEKATPHIIKTDTVNDKITAKVKVFQYIFDSVTEVHEIPDKNTASVKAKLVRTNETPFFTEAFEKKNKKEIIKTLPFRKTTDGWKLCD